MKKAHLAPYCLLLAAGNCFLPWFLGGIAQLMRMSYHHMLEGAVLARLTQFALALPPWLYGFTALSFLACLGLLVQRVPASVLAHFLLVICVLESVALFYFAWGICYTFYGVGPWSLGG